MSKWIRLEDKQPPLHCIVQTVNGVVTAGTQHAAGWLIDGIGRRWDYVTHWQPFPEPFKPWTLAERLAGRMVKYNQFHGPSFYEAVLRELSDIREEAHE